MIDMIAEYDASPAYDRHASVTIKFQVLNTKCFLSVGKQSIHDVPEKVWIEMVKRTAAYPSRKAPPAVNSGRPWVVHIIWMVRFHGINLHQIAENHEWWEGVREF